MVAAMSILHLFFCVVGLGSFVLAQNRTATSTVLSITLSNLTTSKTLAPSTILSTITPGGGTVKATTVVTQTGYQNTTRSSSFETPEPTFTTPPFVFTSAANTPTNPPTSSPTLLQNAASSLKFDLLPITGSVLAFLVRLCVIR